MHGGKDDEDDGEEPMDEEMQLSDDEDTEPSPAANDDAQVRAKLPCGNVYANSGVY